MKKPNAKQRILDTAAQLFHERGYSEVGVNEIIEKAETAKATFYQHFPSKESLCGAWLQWVHQRSETHRSDILGTSESAAEKIDHYFQDLGMFLTKSDFRGCPYSNTGAVIDEDCACLRKQIEEHKASLRDFFLRLATELVGSPERGREVGDMLFLLYSGATIEAQNLRQLWPVEAARKSAREICERESAAAVT